MINHKLGQLVYGALLLATVAAATAARADNATPDGDGDFTIGPSYSDAPEIAVRKSVPEGELHELTMKSEDSKIYPGLTGPYRRRVWAYVPRQLAPDKPAPLLVVQDGGGYVKTVPVALDNLIHERKLPPIVAVLINSGGGDGKGSERGLEYDTVSDQYARFIEAEVLPKIAHDYKLQFTKDPDGRATMGGSSGGAAAFTMGWFRPDLYRRILTYSGTYVNQQSPANSASPHGAWEYHEHLIPGSDAKPLRVWMEVGEHDNGFDRPEQSYHNWVLANQRMAATLQAKAYHYRYVFAKDAKHVDGRVVRQTLPEALLWLWQGYPVR